MSLHRTRPRVAPSDAVPISKLQTLDDVSTLYSEHARSYTPVKFVRMQLLSQGPGDRFNPYDLRVVHPRSDGVEIPLDDYFIVSTSGVVRVTQNGASRGDVISLSEFVREASVFRMLTKIPFFARYLLLKAFTQWHKNIRLKVYLETRRRCAANFFLAQSVFAKPLCYFREQAALLGSQMLIQMPETREGVKHDQFDAMTKEKTHKVGELFRVTLDDCESRLKTTCDDIVQRADIPDLTSPEALHQYIHSLEEEEMRAAGNARRVNAKALSMVAARQNETRRMSQLKAAMHDLQQLPRFIRLVDAVCSESLFKSALDSVLHLFHELSPDRKEEDRVLFFQTMTTFDCPAEIGIAFDPSEDTLQSLLQEITSEIIRVAGEQNRLSKLRAFSDFFITTPNAHKMDRYLQHDARVRTTQVSMRNAMAADFASARESTKGYARNRRWFEFVREWPATKETWQDRFDTEHQQKDFLKSLDPNLVGPQNRQLQANDFATMFHMVEEAIHNLKEMHLVRCNSLIVSSAVVLEALIAGLKQIQTDVKKRLLELLNMRLDRLQQSYNQRIKSLVHEKNMSMPLGKFAAFAQTVDTIWTEAPKLDDIAQQIEEMMEVAVTNNCDCS